MYTVHDRNQLFELTNRHIRSLVSRMEKSKTVGLDHRLLRELLYAGLNCPAFNERQKYTLCIHAGEKSEILKLGDMSKWFPFDTLVYLPGFDYDTCAVCISSELYYFVNTLLGVPSSHAFFAHYFLSLIVAAVVCQCDRKR